MPKIRRSILRLSFALALSAVGGLMAFVSIGAWPNQWIRSHTASAEEKRERYMPVAGEKGEDLNQMELEWHNRLTYPTGHFNPAWMRRAAADHARIKRAIPLGASNVLKGKGRQATTAAATTS